MFWPDNWLALKLASKLNPVGEQDKGYACELVSKRILMVNTGVKNFKEASLFILWLMCWAILVSQNTEFRLNDKGNS